MVLTPERNTGIYEGRENLSPLSLFIFSKSRGKWELLVYAVARIKIHSIFIEVLIQVLILYLTIVMRAAAGGGYFGAF